MNVEYYHDDEAGGKVPCCPRNPSTHELSADKEGGSYYCYKCAEHYSEVR